METVLRPPVLSFGEIARSLARLPDYRDLFGVLTLHRIRVRYRQSVLGPVWAVLQPLALMIIFIVVFSIIAPVSSSGHPYPVFAYTGLLAWTTFASAVTSGSGAFVTHASLITRVKFPREILPATYVAVALFDFLVASTVLLALLSYYQVALTVNALWIVPILLVLAGFATAISLGLAAFNVRYRDVSVAMPLLLQFWMFASPVIYPLRAVPAEWRQWYLLNPMAGIIDSFRRVMLDGLPPDPAALGYAAAITLAALPAAYVWFKHVDATMADQI